MFKKTKIIATIGPATDSEEILNQLISHGMNVARLNFSHGVHEDHKRRFTRIRELEKTRGEPIAVIQDLQGAKIRLGTLNNETQVLKQGQEVFLYFGKQQEVSDHLPVQYDIFPYLKKDGDVLIDDGRIRLRVFSASKDHALCKVIIGGEIRSNKGLNLPYTRLPNPSFTQKDREDLAFGLELGVDYVAVSFVQAAEDVEIVKRYIASEGKRAKVIVKIEQAEAIKNLEEIIETADAVMIARGDLAIEVGQEEVPILQRRIVKLCSDKGVPVIVATQMLESMIHSATPTRAEVNDVATAVFQNVDAVMLSAETALGEYPVECVKMMKQIIKRVENYEKGVHQDHSTYQVIHTQNQTDAIARAATMLAHQLGASMLIALTATGSTGRSIAHARPAGPLFVISDNNSVYRQLALLWGVQPYFIPKIISNTKAFDEVIAILTEQGHLKKHDLYVVVEGTHPGKAGHTNTIRVGSIE